ncbi:MAG: DsbA family protein [Pseudomonadota bacterium]
MHRGTLFAAVTFSFGAFAAAQAEDATFEDRVRAYILNNPEIILEALEILSEREARAQVTARLAAFPELFTEPARLGEGVDDAPLRVVEFFDYKCAPCKAIHPDLVDFVTEHPEVRIEMRHLPILTPASERAARFALAAQMTYGDEAHRAVHDMLWETRGPLNVAGFQRIAEDLSLDFDTLVEAMDSDAVTDRITYNRDAAIALEVLGTPAFLTPDSVVYGSTDIDVLSEAWLSQ